MEWQRARGAPPAVAGFARHRLLQAVQRPLRPSGRSDRVLRSVARAAASFMRRPVDLAARYGGGEELVLLMPDTFGEQGEQLVTGVRLAIEQLTIAHDASVVAPVLTVSVGGATLEIKDGESAAELLDAVDSQLYRAKHAGRNRVEWRAGSTHTQ
ncbi:GGDEF domain-containing protein [Massilia sp. B-10]|nr:GGDEF domain-containing protein [Massilia sp. B-10]